MNEQHFSGNPNRDDLSLLKSSVVITLLCLFFPSLHSAIAEIMNGGWTYGAVNILLYLLHFLLVAYAIFSTFWLDWKMYSAKYIVVLSILIRWSSLVLLLIRFNT